MGGGGSTSGDALLSSAEQRRVAARDALQQELDTLIALVHPDLGTNNAARHSRDDTLSLPLPPLTPLVEGLFDLDHLSTDLRIDVAEEPAEERTEPTGRAAKDAGAAADSSIVPSPALGSGRAAAAPSSHGVSMLGGSVIGGSGGGESLDPSSLLTARAAAGGSKTAAGGKRKGKWRPLVAEGKAADAKAAEAKAAEARGDGKGEDAEERESTQPASIPGWGWVPAGSPPPVSLSEIQQQQEHMQQQQRPPAPVPLLSAAPLSPPVPAASSATAVPIMQFVRMEQQQQLPNGEVEASPRASPAWGGALKAGSAPGAGSLCQILTQQQQPPPPLQQARAPMAMPFKQASPVMAGAPRVPRVALVDAAIDDPVPLSLDGNGPTRAVSLLDFVMTL